MRAGAVDESDTINGRVSRRLQELAVRIRKFGAQKQTDGDEANQVTPEDEEKTGPDGD